MSNTLRGTRSFLFAILLAAPFMGTAACDESIVAPRGPTELPGLEAGDDPAHTPDTSDDRVSDEDRQQARERNDKFPAEV